MVAEGRQEVDNALIVHDVEIAYGRCGMVGVDTDGHESEYVADVLTLEVSGTQMLGGPDDGYARIDTTTSLIIEAAKVKNLIDALVGTYGYLCAQKAQVGCGCDGCMDAVMGDDV